MAEEKKAAPGKLVRDKIPEIIAADGRKAVTHVAAPDEFLRRLREKFVEEAVELRAGAKKDVEELADILELMQTYLKVKGLTFKELESLRAKKAAERGGFEKRIILEKIVES